MNCIDQYVTRVSEILTEAFREERDNLEKAADCIADANRNGRSIFAFGCNHAGLVTQDLFYRSGGMVTINPIRAKGMMLEISPITRTSMLEREEGYGREIFESVPAQPGDVLIIHSVSGRNAVAVEMAETAKEWGLTVIALCNMTTSKQVESRLKSGKKLYDYADILIDNHGDFGDACLTLGDFPERVAPTSTVVGSALLNAVVARASELLLEEGIEPPVFMSANVDGGDEHNRRVLAKYQDNIFYM